MRVLLVDDAPAMRKLLRRVLERETDIDVVGESSNGAEALETIAEALPDIVVLDASMPVMDGVEATKQIRAKFPNVTVLGLTGSDGSAMIAAGASTALLKGDAHLEIVAALRRIEQSLR